MPSSYTKAQQGRNVISRKNHKWKPFDEEMRAEVCVRCGDIKFPNIKNKPCHGSPEKLVKMTFEEAHGFKFEYAPEKYPWQEHADGIVSRLALEAWRKSVLK